MWIPKIASITLLLGLLPVAMAQTVPPGSGPAHGWDGMPSFTQPETVNHAFLNLVRKVYPVADLIVGVDTISPYGIWNGATEAAEYRNSPKADALIKLITNTISPASWNLKGGNARIDYFPIGMGLVVTQTAENHALVADLLSALRSLQDVQVAIEIRVLRMPDDVFEKLCSDSPCCELFRTLRVADEGGERMGAGYLCDECKTKTLFLNQKQAFAFFEAVQGDRRTNVLQAPKVTSFNGQETTLQTGDTQYFMTDVKLIEHDGQKTFVPTNTQHFIGSRFAVRGVVSADHKFVAVKLKAEMSELNGPVPLFPITTMITPVFDGGAQGKSIPFTQYIQQPNIQKLVVEKSATIPDGGTMVIPAGSFVTESRIEAGTPFLSDIPYLGRLFKNVGYSRESQKVVLLVTPHVIVNDDKTKEPSPARPPIINPVACENQVTQNRPVQGDPGMAFTPNNPAVYGQTTVEENLKRYYGEMQAYHEQRLALAEQLRGLYARMQAGKNDPLIVVLTAQQQFAQALANENSAIANYNMAALAGGCLSGSSPAKSLIGRSNGAQVDIPCSTQTSPCAELECCSAKTKSVSSPMNLADIVALASSGICDEIIANQIRTTGASFKLGTEDILFLKKNKVSDAVVLIMQESRNRNEESAAKPACMPVPVQIMPPVHYYPVPVQGQLIPTPAPQVMPPACVPAYPVVQPPLGACPAMQCPAERLGRDMELRIDQSGSCHLIPVRNGAKSEIGEMLIDGCKGIVDIFAALMGVQAPEGQLPVPATTWNAGMTLPTPRYLEHPPQYFPQEPDFPLTRELAYQEEAAGLLAQQNRPQETRNNIKTVYVPIFKNKTLQTAPFRLQEESLTRAVIREIEMKGYKVINDPNRADTELLGTIVSLTKNLNSRAQQNEVREGQLTVGVEVVWRDLRSGVVMTNPPKPLGLAPAQELPQFDPDNPPRPAAYEKARPVIVTGSARYLPEVGESSATAQTSLCNQLAVKIAKMMENDWTLPPQKRACEMPRAEGPVPSVTVRSAPLCSPPLASSQRQKIALSVADIIELGYMGADDKVIINQIRATRSTYELSTEDIRFLLLNGVSSTVIAEMQVSQKFSLESNPVLINPVEASVTPYLDVFEGVLHVVERHFNIDYANRYDGQIICAPKIAAGIEQPSRSGSPDLCEPLLSTLQKMRFRCFINITAAEEKGFLVQVTIYREVEDLARPSVPADSNWTPKGRDTAFENELVQQIRKSQSASLHQANEEVHRFWRNNQPSCLSFERLSGSIGP